MSFKESVEMVGGAMPMTDGQRIRHGDRAGDIGFGFIRRLGKRQAKAKLRRKRG
jgi:hypothetical protein